MIKKLLTFFSFALVFPLTAFAQAGINTGQINSYKDGIISVINTIFIPILFAVALFMFIFGVFRYFILGAADESSRKDGRKFVLWSLIGFVVIVSVWGLVNILQSAFGLSGANNVPNPPTLNFGGSSSQSGTSGSVSTPLPVGTGSNPFPGGVHIPGETPP